MNMSRQLINLAGALAVIVILALGIALVALPMLSQAAATDKQAADTAQTNGIYEIQVATLREQESNHAQLQRDLAELRAEIPATALNDQIFEIVGAAAGATGAFVESVTAAEAEPWKPFGDDVTAEGATTPEATTPEATAPDATIPDAATAEATIPDAAGEAAGSEAGAAEAPASAEAELDPQQVIPFTIVVIVPDAQRAAAFIDALRAADRLLTVEHAALTEEEDGLRLTVNTRSLVLAEK